MALFRDHVQSTKKASNSRLDPITQKVPKKGDNRRGSAPWQVRSSMLLIYVYLKAGTMGALVSKTIKEIVNTTNLMVYTKKMAIDDSITYKTSYFWTVFLKKWYVRRKIWIFHICRSIERIISDR